jgi:hypothetical protein
VSAREIARPVVEGPSGAVAVEMSGDAVTRLFYRRRATTEKP